MILLIAGLLLTALVFFPQLWVRHVMKRHHREVADMPGTGGELAHHLVKRFKLDGIGVEETDEGRDHFDPQAQMVRLSPSNYHGRSVTAVAVAAHEVGHAIQFHRNEAIFELRKKYLPLAARLSRFGIALMWSIPIAAVVLRSPIAVGIANRHWDCHRAECVAATGGRHGVSDCIARGVGCEFQQGIADSDGGRISAGGSDSQRAAGAEGGGTDVFCGGAGECRQHWSLADGPAPLRVP